MILAERMRVAVEAATADMPQHLRVTISLGVAGAGARKDDAGDWKHILKSADDAMYRAKQDGRNCVARATN